MTKEMYISIFIIIVQVSFLKCLPIWSQGCYSKGDVRQVSFTTEEECGQICGQKLLNGELIVGAARDLVDCFCEVSTTGVTLYIGIQRHIDFEVLMLLFNPVSYSIGSLMKISVRISYFAKINDKSEIFMIDSLDDPVKRSGRFIISQLVDLGRSSFATRTLLRHNDSQLVNSIQETYNEDPPYGKVENYYDIIAKIGDMGAENKSTEWAVIQFSNETTTIVTLLPVTITRSVKTCSLKIFSSSKLTNENISVDVNITTTSDCTADLENLTISFNSDRELNFESIVKQDPSMNFSPVIEGGKLKRIFVRKIYIDSLLKFSISYVLNEDLIFEGKNAFIIVMKIWWMGINNDRFTQSFQKIIIQEIKKKLNKRDNTLVHPKWSYNNQNNTKIETTSFVYKCLPVTQRQQAPCYQTEKSSGRVVFLPSEIQDVLRYVPQTNTLYGFTFLNNIISLDLNKNAPPAIISNKKWLAIK